MGELAVEVGQGVIYEGEELSLAAVEGLSVSHGQL
jgi:hypothetical protein